MCVSFKFKSNTFFRFNLEFGIFISKRYITKKKIRNCFVNRWYFVEIFRDKSPQVPTKDSQDTHPFGKHLLNIELRLLELRSHLLLHPSYKELAVPFQDTWR